MKHPCICKTVTASQCYSQTSLALLLFGCHLLAAWKKAVKMYMICVTLLIRLNVFIYGQMFHCNELWDSIFSPLFIKDSPVYPILKEALKPLSLVFGELQHLLLWLMTTMQILLGHIFQL